MPAALKLPPHMTVAEFLAWEQPDNGWRGQWQLRDGEPEMMAPASDAHGSIQSELAYLITTHLRAGGRCRIVVAPGVVPAERSQDNCLVPDLGITCTPPTGGQLLAEPLVLIEILSPTNVSKTRANVRAYMTIPSVAEILVVRSTAIAAEVLRRAPDGTWPQQPDIVTAAGELRLDSIGFAVQLRDAYRTTGLT